MCHFVKLSTEFSFSSVSVLAPGTPPEASPISHAREGEEEGGSGAIGSGRGRRFLPHINTANISEKGTPKICWSGFSTKIPQNWFLG